MAAPKNGGGEEDSEDDDEIVVGVGENFRKHIDALKRACVLEVGHGGHIATPARILLGETPPACDEDDDEEEEEEEEEEDDEELFLSIKNKYGSFGYGSSPWLGKSGPGERKSDNVAEDDDEEEDDEEILRSVEKLYKRGVDDGQQKQGSLSEVESPVKDGSGTNEGLMEDARTHAIPSPYSSPECEPGEFGGEGEAGGVNPEPRSETNVEPGEDVGKSIVSILPGSWIDTDGNVECGDASPAGPLEMMAIEQEGSDRSAPVEETKEYSQPESAEILTDALKKNRECQRTLRKLLSQVEAKQKENADLQRRVRSLVDFEKYCHRRFAGFFTDQANPSIKLIAAKAPTAQNKTSDSSNKTVSDVHTRGPPENPDVEIYKTLQKKVAFNFQTRRWSNEESVELGKGVKQQVYEVLVRQAMDALSNADALDEAFSSLEDHVSKIGGKEFTPQQIRDAVPGIDWAEVARVYVVGRTPEECRARWINHEDSVINKGPWKKMEDKKLLSIAQQHNFCAWEEIAEKLGTNRTPAECLVRYQRSLNASIMRSNWTPEEDNQLRAAVEEWGENDWSAVAACLEGRNNSQCLMRWYKVLHPTKKKRGRWSVEEDKRLKWAVSVYGPKKWKQIAEHVPGRTDLQCRERWCNVLDPSVKLGEWTEDEDRILLESVAKHGPHRWAAVANDLKIRTDNQCCRRWKFLHPEDQPEFQRTVHIRRTALVGNFQGRKKERPRLGPQDFISKGLDFEVYARKAAGKRSVKVKERKKSTQGIDENPVQSMPYEGPRERRAVRILKRRLSRSKQTSNDDTRHKSVSRWASNNDRGQKTVSRQASDNDVGQILGSAPDVQGENEFIDLNNSIFQLRADAVSVELGNINKSGEGSQGKAVQLSNPLEPISRSGRTQRNASQVAEAIDRSTRSVTGRQRTAARGQIIVAVPVVQTDNELMDTNNVLGPDAVSTELGHMHESSGGSKQKTAQTSDPVGPGSRTKRTNVNAPHVPDAIEPSTTSIKWRMRKAARGQIIVAAPVFQIDDELLDTNTVLRPDAVSTDLGHMDNSREGSKWRTAQISDPWRPGSRFKRTKVNSPHVPDAIEPSTTSGKWRMRKAARGQTIVADPDVETDNELMDTNNVLRPDEVSTELGHIVKSGKGMKQEAAQVSDSSESFTRSQMTVKNASHVDDSIDPSARSVKGRKHKADRGQLVVSAPDVQTENELRDPNIAFSDPSSTELGYIHKSCEGKKRMRGQIDVSAPDVQTDSEFMDPNIAFSDPVNTTLGHVDKSREGSQRNAAQVSDPCNGSKLTKQNVTQVADLIDPSARAYRGMDGMAAGTADLIEAGKRTKLQVKRLSRTVSVSHS